MLPVRNGAIDAVTAALIIQTQLDGIERLEENTKCKSSSQQGPPDPELARKLYHDEHENMSKFLVGQAMARGMDVAARTDGQTIAGFWERFALFCGRDGPCRATPIW